jgi:phytoene dehydrogenase-like protein
MNEYDAIVIGSGIGGLAAATRLIQRDHSVLLLEAASRFGGYIGPLIFEDYAFDIGIHYLGKLGPGDAFRKLLDELGLEEFDFLELDPESIDRYIFPDYEFHFCRGREQLADRLIRDFPGEEKGIRQFLDITEKVDQAMMPEIMVRNNFMSWIPYLITHPVMLKYGRMTYQDVLDRITTNKKLQTVLSAPMFDIAIGPRMAAAAAAFGVWNYYLKGAYYPRGGSRALRDTFVQGLFHRGAELVHSAPVTSVSRGLGRWLVKTEKGDEYIGRVVVSDVDPAVTISSLLDRKLVPRHILKKAERLQPSGSIISVFIGTDLDLPSLGIATGNLVHFGQWDINPYYEDWLGKTIPKAEQIFFINSPSVRDPEGGLVPEGHHSLQLLIGANLESFKKWASLRPEQRGEDYEALKKRISEKLVKEAERYVPGLSQHLTLIKCITPLECVDHVRAVKGGIYGLAHSPSQIGPGRFQSLTCGVDGLFLAGAGTFGCGLFFCASSGFLAAEKAATFLRR